MSSLKDSIAPLESHLKSVPMQIGVYQDLPFAIMRYDPTDEWELRREVKLLATLLPFIAPGALLAAERGEVDWPHNVYRFYWPQARSGSWLVAA